MEQSIIYIGLDVHKGTIAVALAEAGLREEVRGHGKISNTPTALKALTEKLAGKKRDLRFCYEAGPCGYGIQRQLSSKGHELDFPLLGADRAASGPASCCATASTTIARHGRCCTGAGWPA
jgi:hypothetical protein